jgi:hypothetical protein
MTTLKPATGSSFSVLRGLLLPALAVLVTLCAAFAPRASAQGALNLATALAPASATTSTSTFSVGVFDITVSGAAPITVYRVSGMPAAAATEAHVWYRIGGTYTTGTTPATTGWVYAGVITGTFPANTPTQIPITLNITLQPTEKCAFGVGFTTASFKYSGTAPAPTTTSNANITTECKGYVATGVTTPIVTNPPALPWTSTTLNPRYIAAIVWYDIAQVQGDSAQVKDFGTVTTGTGLGIPGIGNNVLRVTIRNAGTTTLNGPLPLVYSTDNGVTFPPANAQTFTMTNFAALAEQTFDLTTAAPWVITAAGNFPIVVKIDSTSYGTQGLTKTINFRPDADITAVSTGASDPQIGNNTVQVTVKNNGNFNLTGIPINLRYTVTPGGSPVTETPLFAGGAALAANGGTQTFSFTTPWNLVSGGSFTLTADINPVVTGDPDTSDSFARLYPEAGVPGTVVNFQPITGGNAIPWSSTYSNAKYQTAYNAADVGGQQCQITHLGFYFSTALANPTTWPSVRIALGEIGCVQRPDDDHGPHSRDAVAGAAYDTVPVLRAESAARRVVDCRQHNRCQPVRDDAGRIRAHLHDLLHHRGTDRGDGRRILRDRGEFPRAAAGSGSLTLGAGRHDSRDRRRARGGPQHPSRRAQERRHH